MLSVPSKALRFTPQKETVGKMKIVDVANAKNKVWTIEGNSIVAHKVNIGMTDGTNTQIVGGIAEGTKVITGLNVMGGEEKMPMEAQGEKSPFAPGPPGKNKRK